MNDLTSWYVSSNIKRSCISSNKMCFQTKSFFIILILFLTAIVDVSSVSVTFVYTGTFQGRFFPLINTAVATECLPDSPTYYTCVGGVAKFADKVATARSSFRNVEAMNVGSQYFGGLLYVYYGVSAAATIMNDLQFSAFTLGDAEFLAPLASVYQFMQLLNLNTTFVTTNVDIELTVFSGTRGTINNVTVPFLQRWKVVQKEDGYIGYVGFVQPNLYTLESTVNGNTFPFDSNVGVAAGDLQAAVNEMYASYGSSLLAVVCLMSGVSSQTPNTISWLLQLAPNTTGIDVFLYGDGWTTPDQAKLKISTPYSPAFLKNKAGNNVTILSCGSYSLYSCQTTLSFNGDNTAHNLTITNHTSTLLTGPDPNNAMQAKLSGLYVGYQSWNSVLGTLSSPLNYASYLVLRSGDTPISQFVCDALLIVGGGTLSFFNVGGIRSPLVTAPVTKSQILQLEPFGDTVVTIVLRGDLILEMIYRSFAAYYYNPTSIGPTYLSYYVWGGLMYSFSSNTTLTPKQRLLEVVLRHPVTGKQSLLDKSQFYKVVTNNYIALENGMSVVNLNLLADPNQYYILNNDGTKVIDYYAKYLQSYPLLVGQYLPPGWDGVSVMVQPNVSYLQNLCTTFASSSLSLTHVYDNLPPTYQGCRFYQRAGYLSFIPCYTTASTAVCANFQSNGAFFWDINKTSNMNCASCGGFGSCNLQSNICNCSIVGDGVFSSIPNLVKASSNPEDNNCPDVMTLLPANPAYSAIAYFVCVVNVISIVWISFITCRILTPEVALSVPVLVYIQQLGVLLVSIGGIYFASVLSDFQNNTHAFQCNFYIWFFSIGFILIFGVSTLRLRRLDMILSSKSFRPVIITTFDIVKILTGLVLIQCLVTFAANILSPLTKTPTALHQMNGRVVSFQTCAHPNMVSGFLLHCIYMIVISSWSLYYVSKYISLSTYGISKSLLIAPALQFIAALALLLTVATLNVETDGPESSNYILLLSFLLPSMANNIVTLTRFARSVQFGKVRQDVNVASGHETETSGGGKLGSAVTNYTSTQLPSAVHIESIQDVILFWEQLSGSLKQLVDISMPFFEPSAKEEVGPDFKKNLVKILNAHIRSINDLKSKVSSTSGGGGGGAGRASIKPDNSGVRSAAPAVSNLLHKGEDTGEDPE